jgi:hypothetical protein
MHRLQERQRRHPFRQLLVQKAVLEVALEHAAVQLPEDEAFAVQARLRAQGDL